MLSNAKMPQRGFLFSSNRFSTSAPQNAYPSPAFYQIGILRQHTSNPPSHRRPAYHFFISPRDTVQPSFPLRCDSSYGRIYHPKLPAMPTHSSSSAAHYFAILKQLAHKRNPYRGERKQSRNFFYQPNPKRLTSPKGVDIVEFNCGATRSHAFGPTESIYRGEGQLSHEGERCVVHGGKVATRSYKRIARIRLQVGPWCAGQWRLAFGYIKSLRSLGFSNPKARSARRRTSTFSKAPRTVVVRGRRASSLETTQLAFAERQELRLPIQLPTPA